ncbi:MAG: universal stress protein [Thermodesulfobacteriota bacterium]
MERKILVALNGSTLDQWSCDYLLSGLFADQPQVVFHLLTLIPFHRATTALNLFGDLETVAHNDAAAVAKMRKAKRHLEVLARRFQEAGFAPEQLTCECRFCFGSTANTLMLMGQKGLYDAMLLSKREIPALFKYVSGSISADIMEKNHSLPIWIVNGAPAGENFLVPVDCSTPSLAAVDHLGFMLQGNSTAQVTLFHSGAMLAQEKPVPPAEFHERWGKQWCDEHLRPDGTFCFHASEQVLMEAGISSERVHLLTNKKGVEPARTIARLAREKAFATIVMGRQADRNKGIFKGVSDRVLGHVKDVAVWLVG